MPMWLQNQTQFAFCSLASAWLALFSHFLVKARATVLHGLVGQQPLEAALDRDRNRRRLLRGIGVLVVLGLVGDSALGVVGVLLGLGLLFPLLLFDFDHQLGIVFCVAGKCAFAHDRACCRSRKGACGSEVVTAVLDALVGLHIQVLCVLIIGRFNRPEIRMVQF
jgi:hypothetical protein